MGKPKMLLAMWLMNANNVNSKFDFLEQGILLSQTVLAQFRYTK